MKGGEFRFAAQGTLDGDRLNWSSSRPDGTSQRRRLQVTTEVLRPEGVGNMGIAWAKIRGIYRALVKRRVTTKVIIESYYC
jgi:hypothetical protein